MNADIADAVIRYVQATGHAAFERDVGVDILVETARLWRSLGHHDRLGAFRIDGVTGPDEYSAVADNNIYIYTNLMAQRNLRAATLACESHQARARACGVTLEEMAAWRSAADRMLIRYDHTLGVHEQADGFTAQTNGTSPRPDRTSIRCCCTSPILTSTENRSSSNRISCW